LQLALSTYSANATLLAAYGQYRYFVEQGDSLKPPAQLPVGDKVIIQQIFSETELRDQNNRRTLRQMVKTFWIEGVLAHSLNHEAAIRLNIADLSTLVENRPWQLLPQQSNDEPQPIPLGTHIFDVFNQMNRRLLILGEPGAGKTTTLLELAQALLKCADEDPTFPSPIIFNLSSWAERRAPLSEWLTGELCTRYSIPTKIAQAWVADDKIIPLLDGLDEVQKDYRVACAKAINAFQQEHLVPLVVCSRLDEYESLTTRLKLHGAVLLQPLTIEQIDTYLVKAGPKLATIHILLQQDTELQELAKSPLMLSIMTLAYEGMTPPELDLATVTQTRNEHLFNAYIKRMFGRREIELIYSMSQTIRWLQWLAGCLVQHGETIFLIERMQPDWLQPNKHKPFYFATITLSAGPIYGLIGGLISGLIVGLTFGTMFSYGLKVKLVFSIWLSSGLQYGLIGGLFLGLIIGLIDILSGGFTRINSVVQLGVLRRKLKSSLYTMTVWGLTGGLIFGVADGLFSGLIGSVIGGVIGGLLGGVREIESVRYPRLPWQSVKDSLRLGLPYGIVFGLIYGLLFWLQHLSRSAVVYELHYALHHRLSYGLIFGLIGGLVYRTLFTSVQKDTPTIEQKQVSVQEARPSFRYSLAPNLIRGLSYGLAGGLIYGLIIGLPDGLIIGLTLGLIFALNGEFTINLVDSLSNRFRRINSFELSTAVRKTLKSSLYSTIFWGVSVWLICLLENFWLSYALLYGMISGIVGGVIGGFGEIEPVRYSRWSLPSVKISFSSDLIYGLCSGLVGGLFYGLSILLISGMLTSEMDIKLTEGLIYGLVIGLIYGVIFKPSTELGIPIIKETQVPNQGVKLSLRYSLVTGLLGGPIVGLIVGVSFWLIIWQRDSLIAGVGAGGNGLVYGVTFGPIVGLIFGMILGFIGGGENVVKHSTLRFILWWQGHIPWNYARFLDYATDLIFLRKIGGGYIFVHRLIMEYFADLDKQEIEQMVTPPRRHL